MARDNGNDEALRRIIVPWDFTAQAGHALSHALLASRSSGDEILLLHILPEDGLLGKGADKKAIVAKAESQLEQTVKEFQSESGLAIGYRLVQGSVFTTINQAARSERARLLVMGTHGMQGMQRITGSFALKVVAGSEAPFLIVQSPAKKGKYENLVCPIDWVKTTNIKLSWAKYMNQHYKTKIHLLVNEDQSKFNAEKQEMHFRAAVRYMQEHGIDHKVVKRKGQNLTRETLDYASEAKMDMILIMVTKGIEATDYILGASEQYLISNMEKIPVMCINTKTKLENYH